MKKIAGAFKNRILMATLLIFATFLSMFSFMGSTESSLALEQAPQCGISEHIHSEDCYSGGMLICRQRNHVHDENCYFVRLKDNDINALLEKIDSTEGKNLEALIYQVLSEAVNIGRQQGFDSLKKTLSAGDLMTNDLIVMLNSAIDAGILQSDVVLNKYLNTGWSDSETGNTVLLAAVGDSGIMPLSVGGGASTEDLSINFYVVLDGKLTFINSDTLTYNNSVGTQSRREYCSYTTVVNAYKNVLVTNLNTNNINSTYYFKFVGRPNVFASIPVPSLISSFDEQAAYNNSRVYFENSDDPQHAILLSGKNANNSNVVNFYTVTLDMSEAGEINQVQYVESGLDSTFTLSDDYLWYDGNGNPVSTDALKSIDQTTTLYARAKGNTVSFATNGGTAVNKQIVQDGQKVSVPTDPTREGYNFAGWYTDAACTNAYDFNNNVTGDFTLYAKWTPRSDYTFTYVYKDTNGNTVKTEYANNLVYYTSVALPDPGDGFSWTSGGESFAAGDMVTVTDDRTFTAVQKTLQLTYNINFPESATISTSNKPTVLDYTGAIIVGGTGTKVLSPSSSMVVGTRRIENTTRNCVAYFAGWTVNTPNGTLLLRPGVTLTWKELCSYADANGNISFVGTWSTDTDEIARFFFRLDSTAANYSGSNIDTSTSKYTSEIFTTYVGGDPDTSIKIEDAKPDNSYTADKTIRSLVGERSNETWLYSVPTDEEMFEKLRQYTASNLSEANRLRFVDTNGRLVEYVDGNELDSNHYAIRWYVFKHESDGWHVDGRLVKKEGVIHVEKTFAGDTELIEAGKKGFYVTATHDDTSASNEDRKVLMKLALNDASVTTPSGTTETIAPYSVSDDGLTYIWHVGNVEYDEEWTITEHRDTPTGASVYTEYSIYDSKGTQSAISRYGTEVSLTGVTYAPDEDNDHILRAEFRNFYLRSDSIAIKKEDGKSGQPISGASFELWQQLTDAYGNKNWIQLMFSYDENGNLVFDQDGGTISTISTGSTGYSEILIKDFSYDAGPVRVREVGAPGGYVPAPEIVLQAVSGGSENAAEITTVGGDPYDPADPDDHMYAEYYSNEKVLVVKNYSQATTTITAKKTWSVPEALRTDNVTVELYANGVLASALVPSIEPIVTLTKDKGYAYVWRDMPTYINGNPVTWTLKEVKVGNESLTVNGSFVNWSDTYNRTESRDGAGNLTELLLVVNNDLRRTHLKVEKTDSSGLTALSGAKFRLQQVVPSNGVFILLDDGYDSTGTSDAHGWVNFDNLDAGYYMLTELTPPTGYDGLKNIVYLYIEASGKIQQVVMQGNAVVMLPDGQFEHGLSRPNDFVIRVPNHKLVPLPETGGSGTAPFMIGGTLLTAAALLGFWWLSRRRREGDADA